MNNPSELDASRRTQLANERTYLAWWRTGLTAIAVAVAVGHVLPDLSSHGSRWPYALIGAGFGILAIGVIGYGLRRHRLVEQGLRSGTGVGLDDRAALLLTTTGMVLAGAVVVLIVVRT